MEVLLHWLVALACQQLDKTEVRKWTFRGQEAKQPEEPICQLKSSWEWKELFHNVGNTTLPPAWVFFFPPLSFSRLYFVFQSKHQYWVAEMFSADCIDGKLPSVHVATRCACFNVYHEYCEWFLLSGLITCGTVS